MNGLRLYGRLISISIRSQMQYRASFVMFLLGHGLGVATEMLVLVLLFQRFQTLGSWRLEETALLYGIVQISFAIGEGLGRGFESVSSMIKSGDFDRMLLRPRNTLLQTAGLEIQLLRLGRLVQGAAVLGWALAALGLHQSPLVLAQLLCCILGGAALYFALMILQAVLCFWTTETLELMNIVTHGSLEAGQYPLSIYKPWLQYFFTLFVPLGCIAYLPMAAVLHKDQEAFFLPIWLGWGAPLMGAVFLCAAFKLWEMGLCVYRSTGS